MITSWPLKYNLYIVFVLLLSIGGWWLYQKYYTQQSSVNNNQTNSSYQSVVGHVVSMPDDDLIIQDRDLRYKLAGLSAADIFVLESDGTLIQTDLASLKNLTANPHQIEVAYQMIADKPTVTLIKIKLHSGIELIINNIDPTNNQISLKWRGQNYTYSLINPQLIIDQDMNSISTERWSNIQNQPATVWWTWDWKDKNLLLKQIMINQ